MKDWSKKISS